MPDRILPRYPIYIPSKGRAENGQTPRMFEADGVPFRLVIEEAEYDAYASRYGEDRILVLPFSDQGSVVPARNWIKQHSIDEGHERHWQFDDNIRAMFRIYKKHRVYCRSGAAMAVCEDFTDRYQNVIVSGFQYKMFAPVEVNPTHAPFVLNCRVYSSSLVSNQTDHQWRGVYNEDTDFCLQVLADGYCTILLNAFLVDKIATMKMTGGNTEALYQFTDGRLKMARSLERVWPGVVDTRRRFQRPQHVVKDSWKKFDTPLIPADNPPPPRDYGFKLTAVNEVQSPRLRALLDEENQA